MAHFTPLDTTFNHHHTWWSIKIFIDLPLKFSQLRRATARIALRRRRGQSHSGFAAMTFRNVLLRLRGEIRKLVRIMKDFRFAPGLVWALFISAGATVFSQAPTDAVRVTMSMHPDGSRTVYSFNNAQRTAVATTTDPDGKVRQTIRYQLDDAGRFSTGEVSGLDGRVRLKSRYSMMTLVASRKKPKAQPMVRFCTRLFTVMTQRANKPVTPCSTPPAN